MTGCFSGRVDDYVRTRPSYPHALLSVLHDACGLRASSVVRALFDRHAESGSVVMLYTTVAIIGRPR